MERWKTRRVVVENRAMSPDNSPPQPEIALVEGFFDDLRANDVERALARMDDGVVYQNVPFPADHGKAAVARTLKSFGRVMTGFDVRIKNIAARDGVVLTERVDILTGPLVDMEIWVCGTFGCATAASRSGGITSISPPRRRRS